MGDIYLLSGEEKLQACRYCTDHFREIRGMLGLSQDELAEALGTTQRRISEIENGKAQVSWTLLLALSAIFLYKSDGAKTAYADHIKILINLP